MEQPSCLYEAPPRRPRMYAMAIVTVMPAQIAARSPGVGAGAAPATAIATSSNHVSSRGTSAPSADTNASRTAARTDLSAKLAGGRGTGSPRDAVSMWNSGSMSETLGLSGAHVVPTCGSRF